MFKKRHLLILALLSVILSIISVSALESETIYDQKTASGDSFEVLNKTYKASLFSDNKKLLVSVEDISFTIDVGKCEIKEDIQICFESAEVWYTNYTLDRIYYKAKIVFNRLLAKTTITTTKTNITPIKIKYWVFMLSFGLHAPFSHPFGHE